MNSFIRLNRRSDYISFVEDTRDYFSCPEEWENFFGFCLECDDDGNELEDIWSYSKSNKFETEPIENEEETVKNNAGLIVGFLKLVVGLVKQLWGKADE